MKKIVVLGSTNTDMVITGKPLPCPGQTVSGGRFFMNPGGKGANQAVAVARLSEKKGACVFIAKIGDDVFGRDTARRMKAEGVDAKLIVDRQNPSGTALILVDTKGQNMISVALGANGTLSKDDIVPFKKEIANASVLLLQLETPVKTVEAVARFAHEAGVKVILNPAPANNRLSRYLYSYVDWITPNETEAECLTGIKVTDEASAAKAAQNFRRRGVKHVIITMGSKGAYCDDLGTLFPAKKVRAIDCVAAGDTFSGALAVALSEGKSPAEMVAFAQRASAISVTRAGAQSSIPYRREMADEK